MWMLYNGAISNKWFSIRLFWRLPLILISHAVSCTASVRLKMPPTHLDVRIFKKNIR